jgi:hypothetical protein
MYAALSIVNTYFFINTIKRNTTALLEAKREVSLEVNTDKTEYMVMSGH